MCKMEDITTLAEMKESTIVEYLSGAGYEVVPQSTMKKIEDILKRAKKLAYNKGRYALHRDIKAILPNE